MTYKIGPRRSKPFQPGNGDVSGAMFKLLRAKREMFGGGARPWNKSELKRYWQFLLDTFNDGTRSEMDAALRLMIDELRLDSDCAPDQEETIDLFKALLVFEDL